MTPYFKDSMANFGDTMRRQTDALAKWETENPEVATAWNEALIEYQDRARAKAAAAQVKKERQDVHNALLRVGVPLRALEALAGPFDATEAVQCVEAEPSGVILLSGPAGTGKTVAAAMSAHRAMVDAFSRSPERTKEDPFRTAIFLRAVTAARMSAYGAESAESIRSLTTTRLLILDDLGAEFSSPVWEMLLFEILDTRHGNMLPTVITTNLGKEAIRKQYGERFAERVREGGRAHFLNGESMRGAK